MDKFIDYLQQKNNKYLDVIITGAEYEIEDRILRIKAQYTCDNFSDEDKEQLERDIAEYFGNSLTVECKLKKYLVDKDVIRDFIFGFTADNYPSIKIRNSRDVKVKKIDEGEFDLTINLDKDNYDYISNSEFLTELNGYLTRITKEIYNIKIECIYQGETHDENILQKRYVQLNNSDVAKVVEYDPIEVRHIHNFIGEIDVDFVYPIANIKEQDKACMVGTINFLKITDYESRFKNKDGSSRIAKRVNFQLRDGSDKISCVFFPNMADEQKIDELQEGEKVVVIGDVKESEEHGRSCRIKSIAMCDFDPIEIVEPEIQWKTVNKEYNYIFPKPYETKQQGDLFAIQEQVDKFLEDNTVVVFDLETTGLDISTCEIIEIGAVKMVNGRITEVFETLVKPRNPIPPDATAVNNITNEMVADCLGIDLVFPDFFKFIDGAVLVAYNIPYDCGVLKTYGDKTGYVIDHKQVDVLKLARLALPNQKGYKLGKVVKQLGIDLDNAHRALFDTVATAEVFKKVLTMIDDSQKSTLL